MIALRGAWGAPWPYLPGLAPRAASHRPTAHGRLVSSSF